MKMSQNNNRMARPRQRLFLPAHMILRYLITGEDRIDTLICCRSSTIELVTYDHELYKAVGSIRESDNLVKNKLTKVLEVVSVFPTGRKGVLTEDTIEKIRKKALEEI